MRISEPSNSYTDDKWKNILSPGFLPVQGNARDASPGELRLFSKIIEVTDGAFTIEELSNAFCVEGEAYLTNETWSSFRDVLVHHGFKDVPEISLSGDVMVGFKDGDVVVPPTLISEARAINSITSRLLEDEIKQIFPSWKGDGYLVSSFTGRGSINPTFKWLDGITGTTILPSDIKGAKSHVINYLSASSYVNDGVQLLVDTKSVPFEKFSSGATQLSLVDDIRRYARSLNLSIDVGVVDRLLSFIERAGLEFTVTQSDSAEFIIGSPVSLVDLRKPIVFAISSGVATVKWDGIVLSKPCTYDGVMSPTSADSELIAINFVMNCKLVCGLLYSIGVTNKVSPISERCHVSAFASEHYSRLICPYTTTLYSALVGMERYHVSA